MSGLENAISDIKPNVGERRKSLEDPSFFLNRELSWIRFNARVLEEARDLWHPLLERIKFIAICGSNLDEFFMTRVARLLRKMKTSSSERSMDGMTPMEQIQATRNEILPLIQKHASCWREELIPALAKEDIHFEKCKELATEKRKILRDYFSNAILPSIKISGKQGFNLSSIENLQVNLAVQVDLSKQDSYYVVGVPTGKFPRLVRAPGHGYTLGSGKENDGVDFDFVFLEDLLADNLDLLFPNEKAVAAYPFRLTRNGEIDIIMDESSDFLVSVEKSIQNRKAGFPSRLEFDSKTPQSIRSEIAKAFGLQDYLIYEFDGPLGLVDLWQLLKINRSDLKDQTFLPDISPLLTPDKNLLAAISKHDLVLYHPYDGFEVIVELMREAAADNHVEQIWITMYRMDPESPIVDALMKASKNGKKVTAIIELKAKFDEENNIILAWRLRQAGIKVVYNFPKFKVHAKLCLIVKKDRSGIRRFSHIGSGNYNAVTSRVYSDIGYLTARPEIGEELEELFSMLVSGKQRKEFTHLLVAPRTLKHEILKRIEREMDLHRKTGKGYLAFKLNNLEEKEVIQALYRASIEGVKIDLNVRGLCCLKPGIKGLSENISVISIVGRFLEHARIYYFQNGSEGEMLLGSSDLMFRNLNERVEVLLSLPDPEIRRAILDYILKIHLKDKVKARRLLPDGTYELVRPKEGEEIINSQSWLIQNRGIWHERRA
jgi:polyphosphate kinase